MSEVPVTHALRGVALVACALLVVWLSGCAATPMERARRTIAVSAEAVVAIDHAIAPGFREASREADANPARFRRYNIAVVAMLSARAAIMDAEHALDAIEAGRAGNIGDVIACVVESVAELATLLETVGVEVPEALLTLMSMSSAFVGECGPGHGIDTSEVPSMSEVIQ